MCNPHFHMQRFEWFHRISKEIFIEDACRIILCNFNFFPIQYRFMKSGRPNFINNSSIKESPEDWILLKGKSLERWDDSHICCSLIKELKVSLNRMREVGPKMRIFISNWITSKLSSIWYKAINSNMVRKIGL